MASFIMYQCSMCGYSVATEPSGHYKTMSGEFYNFKCPKCKEIVSLSAKKLGKGQDHICCPKCKNDEGLSRWNPIGDKCPRCGGKMEVNASLLSIMMD